MKLECPTCGSDEVELYGPDLYRCEICHAYFDEGEEDVTQERSSLRRRRERKYDEDTDE